LDRQLSARLSPIKTDSFSPRCGGHQSVARAAFSQSTPIQIALNTLMRNAGPGEKDSPCVTHEKGEKKERGSQRRAGRGGGGGGGGVGFGGDGEGEYGSAGK